MPSTTRATPTAAPSSSRRSAGWPPPASGGAWRADPVAIRTPLIECTKEEIVRLGIDHRAPLCAHLVVLRGRGPPVRCVRRLRAARPRVRGRRCRRPGPGMTALTTRRVPGHPGQRDLLRHPGRGRPRRRAPGVRPPDRVQYPLCLLRPARGARTPARTLPAGGDGRPTGLDHRGESARPRRGGRRGGDALVAGAAPLDQPDRRRAAAPGGAGGAARSTGSRPRGGRSCSRPTARWCHLCGGSPDDWPT